MQDTLVAVQWNEAMRLFTDDNTIESAKRVLDILDLTYADGRYIPKFVAKHTIDLLHHLCRLNMEIADRADSLFDALSPNRCQEPASLGDWFALGFATGRAEQCIDWLKKSEDARNTRHLPSHIRNMLVNHALVGRDYEFAYRVKADISQDLDAIRALHETAEYIAYLRQYLSDAAIETRYRSRLVNAIARELVILCGTGRRSEIDDLLKLSSSYFASTSRLWADLLSASHAISDDPAVLSRLKHSLMLSNLPP